MIHGSYRLWKVTLSEPGCFVKGWRYFDTLESLERPTTLLFWWLLSNLLPLLKADSPEGFLFHLSSISFQGARVWWFAVWRVEIDLFLFGVGVGIIHVQHVLYCRYFGELIGHINSPKCHTRGVSQVYQTCVYCQWIILVLVIAVRDYITPYKAIYTWYISRIYCQLGDFISPTTYDQNQNNLLTSIYIYVYIDYINYI